MTPVTHRDRSRQTGRTIAAETDLRTTTRPLRSAAEVHGYVRRICFKTGPPTLVGAELEWMVTRERDPDEVVPLAELRTLITPGLLRGGSSFTLEPGGQVELSSTPARDLGLLHRHLADDVAALVARLGSAGISLVPSATDARRLPTRQLSTRRYDAMEAYFDTLPHDLGRVMMCSTAAIQVNLDAGRDAREIATRWQLLELLGPPLVAVFANSPMRAGRPTGWKSTRQAVWQGLDPRRTHAPVGADPVAAWADYALASPLMVLRTADEWRAAPGFTFGQWVEGQLPDLPAPSEDDLAFHLSTLFPPVRPRGWFEVRYLDAQDPRWWPVPVAVVATALDQPDLHDRLREVCAPVAGRWLVAARGGPSDPALADAALAVFSAVVPRIDDADLRTLTEDFHEHYLARGRCPADDVPKSEEAR